jgi:hypothetical protein
MQKLEEETIKAYSGIQKSTASINSLNRTFINEQTNLSIRSDYGNQDFNYYRPSSNVPERQEDIIALAMKCYDKIGIVKNAFDLMGDFATQGIDLVHPNKAIEKFYKKWFKKVNGPDRSERFLNMLYRTGNVIVRRLDGKIKSGMVDDWKKTYGESDIEFKKISSPSNTIPARYIILNPLSVEVIGGELASFIGKPIFALKINSNLQKIYNEVQTLRGNVDRFSYVGLDSDVNELLSAIPANIELALKSGARYLPLEQDKISAYYYKKDDWQTWANPILYSVMDDLIHLDKLHLADSSALDGAISNIRLWNVGIYNEGRPNDSILPTAVAINKIRNILANNIGGGTLDLVVGPEVKMTESNSQVHHFLGPEKFAITLAKIYVGLGLPPVLTGSAADSGFTNNYITVKTLVERLEYGRGLLVNFWTEQIERVQKAMGFRFPAQVVFDQMILSDEAAEKALLIQLADRNMISDETIRAKFDLPSDIEKIRIKRESNERDSGNPPKAGPFHNPQTDHEIKKMVVQQGNITPGQVGVKLNPKAPGEKTPNDLAHQKQVELADKKGQDKTARKKFKPSGKNGRPKNSGDKTKRKKKRVLPKTKAVDINTQVWATQASKTISDMVTPAVLSALGKSNLRKLTVEEFNQLELIKFDLLCNLLPFEEVTTEKVYSLLRQENILNQDMRDFSQEIISDFRLENNRKPTAEENRLLQCNAYAAFFSEDDDE